MTNQRIIQSIAAQLDTPVSKQVHFGNMDPNTRFFSLRADIPPHFHKAQSNGARQFYCGTCMHHVSVLA